MFLTQPQDATVVEGGDATFQCAAEENGMALLFGWDFAPVGGSRMAVITGSQLAGVTMVTVSGDRTQLTLGGVQREVNGATVVCGALGSTSAVDSNPVTISVRCKHLWRLCVCVCVTHACCRKYYRWISSFVLYRPSCIHSPPKPTHHCVGRRRLHLLLWV